MALLFEPAFYAALELPPTHSWPVMCSSTWTKTTTTTTTMIIFIPSP